MAAAPAIPLSEIFKKPTKEKTLLQTALDELANYKAQKTEAETKIRELTPFIEATLAAHNAGKVEYHGFIHTRIESVNTSISQENLKASLLRHGIDPDVITAILGEVVKKTPYVAIQTTVAKSSTEPTPGGLTGK